MSRINASDQAADLDTINHSEPEQLHSRILRYDEYFDLRTFSVTLRKTNKNKVKKLDHKKPVIVVRRIINRRGEHAETLVDIKSPALCKTLLDINQDVEGSNLTPNNATITSKGLFHSRQGLAQKLEDPEVNSDSALTADIKTALRYIEEEYGSTLGDLNLLSHQEISYGLLWVLFPPNALVHRFHSYTEQMQILLARTFEYRRRPEDGSFYAAIVCDVITNDGSSFGFARDTLEIDEFVGARRIQDLVVFPLDYHPGKQAICESAKRRGKKIVNLAAHSYHEISGSAMRESRNTTTWKVMQFKFATYGRVMIDPAAFRLFEPNCTYNLSVHRRVDHRNLTDEQYMICTPVVLGFCFGVKMWGGFAVDRLEDIVWSDEAFRSLVLGAKQKLVINSLFKSHARHAATFDDVVKGKGKGLIGLFSGSPGCGKTLTAEAVAEMTRRPLYSVSAGELGTEPKELDERLKLIMQIAQMWDAVLILDEAEVFLAKRSMDDITRNALVSIFLRQLEYYQGILILTTNLIADCDPAFESRIHLSIHYPDLGFDSRRQIWQTFFAKVIKNPNDISPEDLDRLARIRKNGRQIKNIVSSAQCIALDAKMDLSVEHVDAVLEVVDDWDTAQERSKVV
ncbi:P-loop containing nucleoside triphosphate hydrolase protein [Mycena galopus ATCC 62051]|nr:P-loop containing nucleoside triphosphate hydrolase protein [Mycena galopus ATCC 62051]